jgi:hypothetical protein
MGIRRNFVPRRGKLAPYFDGRLGMGNIDAKGPDGVAYAQGQNFTFTMNMGSGVRYNFNRRYSISGGLNWMHISNLYLSEPKYRNYGINVYGPMAGINVLIGKPHRDVVHKYVAYLPLHPLPPTRAHLARRRTTRKSSG